LKFSQNDVKECFKLPSPEKKDLQSFMKDLEPILNVLCSYQAGLVLSEDELFQLREWLGESTAHEQLFDDLNNKNGMQFIMGVTERNIREKIQTRLIEIEESGG
jgi:hypothetical protein